MVGYPTHNGPAVTPVPPTARSRRAGMTLIELLLAMAGTTLIAAAIASLSFAVSYDARNDRDLRGVVGQHRLVTARFNAAVRSATMILQKGNTYVVLWMSDTNDSELPDLSEIRLIEYDGVGSTLTSYRAPATLNPLDDVQYNLTDDFKALLDPKRGGATFPAMLWASNVSGLSLDLDDANAQLASLVSYRVTVQTGGMSDTIVGASTLRSE